MKLERRNSSRKLFVSRQVHINRILSCEDYVNYLSRIKEPMIENSLVIFSSKIYLEEACSAQLTNKRS